MCFLNMHYFRGESVLERLRCQMSFIEEQPTRGFVPSDEPVS